MNNRGYILITMMFMMLLMAVTAVGMNRRAGMQARMVSNQARSVQIYFGQLAAIEHARWSILRNPAWRTDPGGEDYIFEGVTYNRLVEDCTVTGYEDAVTVAVTAPGGLNPMKVHFRWQLVERSKPVTMLYIADKSNNRIRKVDGDTGIITTVAGTGSAGYNGDNQPATNAQLCNPDSVFVDGSGNIYIGDDCNHRIRKVDWDTGIITTVAGTGSAGYNGDNQPATSAQLNYPVGLFVDGSGNIYFCDEQNYRVRKVEGTTGIITTVAGTGVAGYSGDGGPATSAKFNFEWNGWVWADDHGNIYISDYANHRIRMVDGDTGIIRTVAGTGSAGYNGDNQPATSAQLSWPNGLFTDASGNIYIADYWNNRIRKVDGATGIITLVAGKGMTGFQGDGGLATQAKLNHPIGVFVNAYGDVYIADTDNHCIRKVDGATGIITTVAGIGQSSGYSGDGGPATSAKLNNPDSVFEQTIYLSLPPSWGFAAVQGL